MKIHSDKRVVMTSVARGNQCIVVSVRRGCSQLVVARRRC